MLFRPDLIGEECEGLHEVLTYSIQKSDLDLRKVLFQNIVLSGGSTLFRVCMKLMRLCSSRCKLHLCKKYCKHVSFVSQGFGDRLLSEIRKMVPKDIKIRVCKTFNGYKNCKLLL